MTSPRILLINSEQVIAVDVIDPDTVAEARDDWDVLLLDWRDNGPDFLAALRAHPATARACIVGITSYTDPMLVVAAKKGGINGWVVRPLAGASLADAINKAVVRAAA